jgi:tetratricopeptide (TPR) repeat protein
LKYAQKAAAIWGDLHGEYDIDTAMALDAVGSCYRFLGKNKEALEFAERALAIRERVLGRLHPDTAQSFSNVGNIYAGLGDFSRALQNEERALAIVEELFGARSPLKAGVLKNMGLAYRGLREFKKALDVVLEALDMRRALFGDQHPETVVSVVDAAVVHFDLGHVHIGFQLLDEWAKKIPKGHTSYEYLKQRSHEFHSRISRPGFRQPGKRR